MAAEGEIIYSKVEFSDTFVSEKYGYPSMFFITDNVDKITKVIAYDETGRKSVSVFNNNVSEVVRIGTITTNSSKVFIAVHSSGANEVLIDGNNYNKVVSDEFNYTPITPGNIKVLIIYALPTSQLFYIAEGTSGTEAVDPVIPIGGFVVKRVIISYDGVTIEEINAGFRPKAVDSWVTQIGLAAGSPQTISVHYLSTRFIIKSDGTNVQLGGFKIHSWANVYNGQPISVRNDSNADLLITTIIGSTSSEVYPINPSHVPMTLKKGETAQFAINFNSHTVDIIKSPGGGSAEFPPFSSDNLTLMSDSTAPGKVKWSNRLLDRLTSSIQEITGFVDFLGFLKSKYYFFTTDTTSNILGDATPDKMSSDGIRTYYTDTLGVTREHAYLEDITNNTNLLKRYVHTSNREIQPTAVDYATGYITAPAHGFTHSGQRKIGLYINDLHKLLGDYETSSANVLSDYTVIVAEWLKADCYVKVIDANTLMLCSSTGTIITVNTANAENSGRDHTKWHIEDYSTFSFADLPIGYKRLELVLKGMMSPFSSSNTNRYLTPHLHLPNGSIGTGFRASQSGGTQIIVGVSQPYLVLAQPVTSGKQCLPFFHKTRLDISDVIISREYIESVYNYTGGIVTKLNDLSVGTCTQNLGLAGFKVSDNNMADDRVFFSNYTVVEVYKL